MFVLCLCYTLLSCLLILSFSLLAVGFPVDDQVNESFGSDVHEQNLKKQKLLLFFITASSSKLAGFVDPVAVELNGMLCVKAVVSN